MRRLTFCLALLAMLIAGTVGAYRIIEVPEVGARTITMVMGGVAAGAACDSCTGGLIFSIHFEADADVDTGSPCGCTSLGDTTATKSGTAAVVTGTDGYLDINDASEYVSYDISSFPTSGSFLMKIKKVSYDNGTRAINFYGDADSYLILATDSTDDLSLTHLGGGTSRAASCTNNSFTVGGTFYVVGRWTAADADPNISLYIYAVADESLLDSNENNFSLGTMATTPPTLAIGNMSASDAGDFDIYYVKVWDTYAGAPSSGFPAK